MALGFFSDINLTSADAGGTIAGGTSWHPIFGPANLQNDEDYIGAPARCLDATDTTQSWLERAWPEPQLISYVGLWFHTLSLGARVRITAAEYDDVGYAAPLLQTDWLWAYPSLYDPEELLFGVENFWAGTVTLSELDLYGRHTHLPIAEVLAGRVRIEIDDQENPDGWFDIGGLWMTPGFSPAINFERGRELSVLARDLRDEAPSGRVYSEKRRPRRELPITYAALTDPELRRFMDAAMRATTVKTVFFAPNLDDVAGLMREGFPATLGQPPKGRTTYPGLGQVAFTLSEILA